MPRLPRLLLAAVLALGALVVAGCGQREDIRTLGETEGLVIDVGPLVYQVQISRYLNPDDVEDRTYLEGLSPAAARLADSQVWFGVFMRVQNYTDRAHVPATDVVIEDTQHNRYEPVSYERSNPFVYRARPIPAEGVLPHPSSLASQGPIGGELLLYKLDVSSVQNRPLELKIAQGEEFEGVIDLDV